MLNTLIFAKSTTRSKLINKFRTLTLGRKTGENAERNTGTLF